MPFSQQHNSKDARSPQTWSVHSTQILASMGIVLVLSWDALCPPRLDQVSNGQSSTTTSAGRIAVVGCLVGLQITHVTRRLMDMLYIYATKASSNEDFSLQIWSIEGHQ